MAALSVLVIVQHGVAQDVDTVQTKPFDRFWTKPRIIPKAGIGTQDRAFVELGIQWHTIYKHPFTLASKGPYATVDVFIDKRNLLLGPKLGYEITAGVFGLATDVTYFMDRNFDGEGTNRQAWTLTPKAGLTILGFANLYYGYSIPISSERITSISRNRFSLVFNLNSYYLNLKEAPKRDRH